MIMTNNEVVNPHKKILCMREINQVHQHILKVTITGGDCLLINKHLFVHVNIICVPYTYDICIVDKFSTLLSIICWKIKSKPWPQVMTVCISTNTSTYRKHPTTYCTHSALYTKTLFDITVQNMFNHFKNIYRNIINPTSNNFSSYRTRTNSLQLCTAHK